MGIIGYSVLDLAQTMGSNNVTTMSKVTLYVLEKPKVQCCHSSGIYITEDCTLKKAAAFMMRSSPKKTNSRPPDPTTSSLTLAPPVTAPYNRMIQPKRTPAMETAATILSDNYNSDHSGNSYGSAFAD